MRPMNWKFAVLLPTTLAAPGSMGGSKEKARERAEEVRKLNEWLGFLAWTQIYRQDKGGAELERELRAWVRAFPDSTQPHLGLGIHYQQLGEAALKKLR